MKLIRCTLPACKHLRHHDRRIASGLAVRNYRPPVVVVCHLSGNRTNCGWLLCYAPPNLDFCGTSAEATAAAGLVQRFALEAKLQREIFDTTRGR